MEAKVKIVKSKYLDSVKLMLISRELRSLPGIIDAVAILATPENLEILAATDMLVAEAKQASDRDIVIVAKGETQSATETAIAKAETLLSAKQEAATAGSGLLTASDQASAAEKLGGADLCLVSVAGKFAAAEAEQALEQGMHVLLFSDNVSLEDELRLKRLATEKALLMMGPDCGTAIINGVPLAFANSVPRGGIGLVSASGTGLQEVAAGIANRGCGISQALGTGGRDGKKEIGGLMLQAGFDFLINDPQTEVIVLIAKTPDPEVQSLLWEKAHGCGKPVIANFLTELSPPQLPNLQYCTGLDSTAGLACLELGRLHRQDEITRDDSTGPDLAPLAPGRKYIRGLYSGGTLCYEAVENYRRHFGQSPFSNIGSDPSTSLKDLWQSEKDCFIDLGDDEFTVGRPHPMIDFDLRLKRLRREAADPETALIILDVVLGWGAHPDPSSELVPVLKALPPEIVVVCHVLGTKDDPQDKERQVRELAATGAKVFTAHEAAVDYALRVLSAGRRLG